MTKLLVSTMILWVAACQSPRPNPESNPESNPDTDTVVGALIGSGSGSGPGSGPGSGSGSGTGSGTGSGSACGCPPGTELRVNDEGQPECVTPECHVTADCPPHDSCVSERCVPVPCTTSAGCDAPLVCVDGACVEPPCTSCPGGYHCVVGAFPEGDHVCVVNTCSGDPDCAAGLLCVDHACVDEPVFCTSDGDCPSGHCAIEVAAPPGDCDGAPCPAGAGVCVPIGGCTGDAQCPSGQRCDTGTCVAGPGPCTSDADCPTGTCRLDTGACLDPGGCIADVDCPPGELCLAGTCGVLTPCTSDQACGPGLRCLDGACTDCTGDGCDQPPPGGGSGSGSGSDAGVPGPGSDGGLPGPGSGSGGPTLDAGVIHLADAGMFICPAGCGQRTGYHLFCPSRGQTVPPSWCPPSQSCGAMDSCQSSQLASCNAGCPGGCVTIFDGPVSCCDCVIDTQGTQILEVSP